MQENNHSMHGNDAARPLRVHLAALDHKGSVVMHDGKELVKGAPLDISETGMFVETKDMPFDIGDRVQVTVKIPGLLRSFSQDCEVTRVNTDARFPLGFGVRFSAVPMEVKEFFGDGARTRWGEYFLLTPEQRAQKILLVDNDREFDAALQRYASFVGITMDVVPHLGVFPDLRSIDAYDTLLVCDDLVPFSGLEIAEILGKYLPHKPIVMLTMTRSLWQASTEETPNVVGFASKWDGNRSILSRVLKPK